MKIEINKDVFEVDINKLSEKCSYFSLLTEGFGNDENLSINLTFDGITKELIQKFFDMVCGDKGMSFLKESKSYGLCYELGIYFGCDVIVGHFEDSLRENISLDFIEISGTYTADAVKIYDLRYVFDMDYLFVKNLFSYNKKLLVKFLENGFMLVNDKYVNVMKGVMEYGSKLIIDDFIELTSILKENVCENRSLYGLFLIDLFDLKREMGIVEGIDVFRGRFKEFSFGVFEGFDWNGIVFSGGGALYCLSERVVPMNEFSDVDMWIYGLDENVRREKFNYVLGYFKERFGGNVFFCVNGKVVTIVLRGIKRNFQIIVTGCIEEYEVVRHFNIDYVQCLYDGERVYGTIEFIRSMYYQTAEFYDLDGGRNVEAMLSKAFYKGYKINYMLGEFQPFKEVNKYYYPGLDDKDEIIIEKIKEIFKPKIISKNIDFNDYFWKDKIYFPMDFKEYNLPTCTIKQGFLNLDEENVKINIKNVVFSMSVEHMYHIFKGNLSGSYIYEEEKMSSSRKFKIKVNLNNVDQNIVGLIQNIYKKIKENNDVDFLEFVKIKSQTEQTGFQINELEKKFYPSDMKEYINLQIQINCLTEIVYIHGNKITKIPRLSYANLKVNFMQKIFKQKLRGRKGEVIPEHILFPVICEQITILPPNHFHNMNKNFIL